MNISHLLTKEAQSQGLRLEEPDDHILELRHGENVIARFTPEGIALHNEIMRHVRECEQRAIQSSNN